jgi:hypothetical protein
LMNYFFLTSLPRLGYLLNLLLHTFFHEQK